MIFLTAEWPSLRKKAIFKDGESWSVKTGNQNFKGYESKEHVIPRALKLMNILIQEHSRFYKNFEDFQISDRLKVS